jgi:RNA polymerase sigma-70 factor (ECF subfamily)
MRVIAERHESVRMPLADIPEEDLIRRVVDGETDLYGILADRYSLRIHRFVHRIVGSKVDAEDAVQEAHLRALTHLHQFKGRCRFVTWLSKVAANEAFRIRRQQYRLELLAGCAEGHGTARFVSSERSPEHRVLDIEIRNVLREALSKLPPRYRTIFILKNLGHLTTPEVAGRLNIRCDNVRLMLHRARRMLRAEIAAYSQFVRLSRTGSGKSSSAGERGAPAHPGVRLAPRGISNTDGASLAQ